MLDKPDNSPAKAIGPELLARFAAIVGDKYAITDPQAQTPYLVEMRDLFRGHSPMVLRPGSVAEVSAILQLANETATPIVPQGGNTGLVGGQIPHHNEIVLSLNRLDRIREVDPTSYTITCEAGVTLQRAREAAAAVDRLYPQLLPSEGTCTIGGNLATNAGGTAAIAHGIARAHALGLEVVLADGRVLNDLNKLKKDNTGYDLKNLFIGAEGTLGVITAAVLRLVPRPRSVETAFAGVAVGRGGARTSRHRPGTQRRRRHELRDHDAGRHRARAASRARLPRSARFAASLVRADGAFLAAARGPARHSSRRCWPKARSEASSLDATIAESIEQAQGVLARCAKCSARCSATLAARSSMTFRCRSPRCRPSSRKPTPRHRAHSRCAAAAVRPSRRRQYSLQRQPAGRRR